MCKVIWLIYLILSKIRKQINKKKNSDVANDSIHFGPFNPIQFIPIHLLKNRKKKFELRLPVLNLNLLTKDR